MNTNMMELFADYYTYNYKYIFCDTKSLREIIFDPYDYIYIYIFYWNIMKSYIKNFRDFCRQWYWRSLHPLCLDAIALLALLSAVLPAFRLSWRI